MKKEKMIFKVRRKSVLKLKSFECRSFKLTLCFKNAQNITSQFVYRLIKMLRIQRVESLIKTEHSEKLEKCKMHK